MAAQLLIVIEARDAERHVQHALDRAAGAGSQVRRDWSVGGRADHQVCVGIVASRADAVDAVAAAVRGSGVVAVARAPREVVDRLLADLRRVGPTTHVTEDSPVPIRLDRDERALLAMLAEGLTLGEAAESLGIPRRTADRRVAAARRTLGVKGTVEALAVARRLGLLADPGSGERA